MFAVRNGPTPLRRQYSHAPATARLLRSHAGEPRKIVTVKLRSYGVAHRELTPDSIHGNDRYANNWAEQSPEPKIVRERGMRGPASRKFKSVRQTQRFLGAHAAVSNLFNLRRHLVRCGPISESQDECVR